ncbi:MAG TPA: DUF4252 domain-containing protein [Bacteroidales bacterium]|nr:DUF4252 domain-containing protein [Bacteroidales bacterium]
MNKLILVAASLLLANCTFAQKDIISDVFSKYAGAQGVTTVNITGDMLNLITQAQQQMQDTVFTSKLTEVRILALEKNCDKPADINLKSEVYDKLDKSVYKEMMSVKEQDEDVVILIKEAKGRISEVLLIAGGKDDNALIQVKGDMLLSEVAKMAGKYQGKGFDHFKMLEK